MRAGRQGRCVRLRIWNTMQSRKRSKELTTRSGARPKFWASAARRYWRSARNTASSEAAATLAHEDTSGDAGKNTARGIAGTAGRLRGAYQTPRGNRNQRVARCGTGSFAKTEA